MKEYGLMEQTLEGTKLIKKSNNIKEILDVIKVLTSNDCILTITIIDNKNKCVIPVFCNLSMN